MALEWALNKRMTKRERNVRLGRDDDDDDDGSDDLEAKPTSHHEGRSHLLSTIVNQKATLGERHALFT